MRELSLVLAGVVAKKELLSRACVRANLLDHVRSRPVRVPEGVCLCTLQCVCVQIFLKNPVAPQGSARHSCAGEVSPAQA